MDTDKPVSRQFEVAYNGYFGWPAYWGGAYMLGYAPAIERNQTKWMKNAPGTKTWDSDLRSTHTVSGYKIQATDGDIGHVEDFIIDDETWAIRYLVIDTRNWLAGRNILVSLQWIESISWKESKVFINLLRETIRQAPEYTQDSLITRDYEVGLHKHYGYNGYWVDKTPMDLTPSQK